MIWRDILIDRRPTDTELLSALAHVFQVSESAIQLFGDYSELLDPEDSETRILCERLLVDGEFQMKLGIMPVHPDQEAFTRVRDDIKLVAALCSRLGVRGLIDDGSDNPYTFLLIAPDDVVLRTDLDAVQLDTDGRYMLLPQVAEVGG